MHEQRLRAIAETVARVIVGKERATELLLAALLAEGHVLIEDLPGLGKTVMAKALAAGIGGRFRRIQFTPDLLPSDVTGFSVYDAKSGALQYRPGPVHANVLLADEINRTIPRTQSSLLEAMEERQVTVEGEAVRLPRPFFVIATQNPIELAGTFPLPEAQLDRFLMRISLGYPDRAEELAILERFQRDEPLPELRAAVSPDEVILLQDARKEVIVSAPVREYIVDLCESTRRSPQIRVGASPRASLALLRASQALAMIRGRDYVLPDDVRELAGPVLLHRLLLHPEEEARGTKAASLLPALIASVAVPVASGD